MLTVYVWRGVTCFQSPTDPQWIAQLAFPSDIPSLRREWRIASGTFEQDALEVGIFLQDKS